MTGAYCTTFILNSGLESVCSKKWFIRSSLFISLSEAFIDADKNEDDGVDSRGLPFPTESWRYTLKEDQLISQPKIVFLG